MIVCWKNAGQHTFSCRRRAFVLALCSPCWLVFLVALMTRLAAPSLRDGCNFVRGRERKNNRMFNSFER